MTSHEGRPGSPASWLAGPRTTKVLYVSPAAEPSGAERAQLAVLAADPAALVACPEDSPNAALVQGVGATTIDLPFRSLRHSAGRKEAARSVVRGLRAALDLRAILARHPERTLVYCFTVRPGLLASLASVGMHRALVWNVTDLLPRGPLGSAIRCTALIRRTTVICHSETIRQDFASGPLQRHLALRCTTINPGVDVDRFAAATAAPGAPRALVVGHVSPTKRTALAVQIATQVLETHPDFHLRVLGRAQYREEDFAYERRLHEDVGADRRLADHISFEGYSTDVAAEMQGAGMLLHVRPDEPFGIVLVEAMAAGLPVVAPRAAGPAEIIDHGVTGRLFEVDDAGDAAAQVRRLLDDPEEATRIGEAAGAVARGQRSFAAQVEQVDRVLRRIGEKPS